jgi:hypothetical protein
VLGSPAAWRLGACQAVFGARLALPGGAGDVGRDDGLVGIDPSRRAESRKRREAADRPQHRVRGGVERARVVRTAARSRRVNLPSLSREPAQRGGSQLVHTGSGMVPQDGAILELGDMSFLRKLGAVIRRWRQKSDQRYLDSHRWETSLIPGPTSRRARLISFSRPVGAAKAVVQVIEFRAGRHGVRGRCRLLEPAF